MNLPHTRLWFNYQNSLNMAVLISFRLMNRMSNASVSGLCNRITQSPPPPHRETSKLEEAPRMATRLLFFFFVSLPMQLFIIPRAHSCPCTTSRTHYRYWCTRERRPRFGAGEEKLSANNVWVVAFIEGKTFQKVTRVMAIVTNFRISRAFSADRTIPGFILGD